MNQFTQATIKGSDVFHLKREEIPVTRRKRGICSNFQSLVLNVVAVLLLAFPGGQLLAGKGGKPGGGGGQTCTVVQDSSYGLLSRLVSGSVPVIPGVFGPDYDFDGFRIGNQITAVESGSSVLLAVVSTSSANASEAVSWLHILTFTPPSDWGHVQTIQLSDQADFDLEGGVPLFADLDGNPFVDLLVGSRRVGQVVAFYDVQDPALTSYDVLNPPEPADYFGSALAWGDVVVSNPGPEIVVGASLSDAVFFFNADHVYLGKLLNGSGRFGESVALGASPGLYVGAKEADESKKTRDSGKVFYFAGGVSCDSQKICVASGSIEELQRGIKNEELGRRIAVANSDGDAWEDLVAVPARSGSSVAVFPGNEDLDLLELPIDSSFGLRQNLSVADVDESGRDEVVLGTPNAGSDTGGCGNVGAVHVFVDSDPTLAPVILRSPDSVDQDNLMFGWGAYAIGDYIFVTERGRKLNAGDTQDGQIYVFVALP
jgi:hypothetical protein